MNKIVSQKYLIIEDEEEISDFLLRLLIDGFGIPSDNVEEASTLEEAKEIIDDFEPHIVLLDLKIPLGRDHEPDIINAFQLIQHAELYNYRQHEQNNKIKIIVISGSVEDRGVQQILKMDKNRIFDFFDKGDIAGDVGRFQINLKKKIGKAIVFKGEVPSIDYSFVRKGIMKKLEDKSPDLWQKIDEQILMEFEKISDPNINEANTAKIIIINCGEIVEDILALFTDQEFPLANVQYSVDDNSVIRKLTRLSGRQHDGFENGNAKYLESVDPCIRRITQEYAHKAYQLSSHARHSKKGDDHNNKWFAGYEAGFTKEDAAISINLIVPLIQDFIEKLKKQ